MKFKNKKQNKNVMYGETNISALQEKNTRDGVFFFKEDQIKSLAQFNYVANLDGSIEVSQEVISPFDYMKSEFINNSKELLNRKSTHPEKTLLAVQTGSTIYDVKSYMVNKTNNLQDLLVEDFMNNVLNALFCILNNGIFRLVSCNYDQDITGLTNDALTNIMTDNNEYDALNKRKRVLTTIFRGYIYILAILIYLWDLS